MPKIKVQLIPKEGKGYKMFECESDKIAEASLVEYQGKQYAYMTINGSWKNPTAVFREGAGRGSNQARTALEEESAARKPKNKR